MASESPRTITRGQISFVDLADGKTMNFYLTANRPTTQIFSVDDSTFNPDYTTNNLVITPELYISGSTANQMTVVISGAPVVTNVEYKINGTVTLNNTTRTNAELGATYDPTNGHTLTFSKNIAGAYLNIVCSCKYTDPEISSAQTIVKSIITITRMDSVGNSIIAVMLSPLGTTIKNNEPGYVLLHCDMWRGSTVDGSGVSYKWFRRDNRSGDGVDLEEWYEITSASSYGVTGLDIAYDDFLIENYDISDFSTATFNVNTIKIPASSVDNYDVFKCEITDIDTESGTDGQTVYDTETIIDQTDPYLLQFTTSNGTQFKEGIASSQVTADIWQNGRLLSTIPNSWVFTWTKRDRTGAVDNTWYPYPASGTSGSRMGSRSGPASTHRTITISRDDVTISALFSLEITIPQS